MSTTTLSANNIQWLQFNLLQDQKKLSHAFFCREGGVSPSPFNSLNISYSCGDRPENIIKNQQFIKNVLHHTHGKTFSIHRPQLFHGADIAEVTPDQLHWPRCDTLVTRHPNTALMITHADCQATIIYDPVVHVVANVHSGWRGSVQNIYQKTVDYLKQQHGCKAENLLACIGPSLGPNSSEFINFKTELPETFLDFQVKPFYFDFWAISRWQLKCAGLLDHHIECAQIDTKQDSRFFSHRRDKKTGRNAAMVILK